MPESSNSENLGCNRLHWWALTNLQSHKKHDISFYSVEIQGPVRRATLLISNFRRFLNVVCFLLGNSPTSEFICWRFGTLCLFLLPRRIGIRLWKWNRQSVPKRRHIKFRRRGITQKKAYNMGYIPW